MNTNDALIRRLYTRSGAVVDDSLPVGVNNELVIEWEAGANINSLGVNLDLIVVTRNVNTNANEVAPLTQTITVTTNGANANTGYEEVITIPANTLTSGVMYESVAALIRAVSEIHSFSDWWLYIGI